MVLPEVRVCVSLRSRYLIIHSRFTTVFPYHHRVFYCRDILLYKPNFRPEDFEIYVSYTLLYVLAFGIPPIVVGSTLTSHAHILMRKIICRFWSER